MGSGGSLAPILGLFERRGFIYTRARPRRSGIGNRRLTLGGVEPVFWNAPTYQSTKLFIGYY